MIYSSEIINASYINFVEKTSEINPTSVLDQENTNLSKAIDIIILILRYSWHPSAIKIKKNSKNFDPFSFQKLSITTSRN